MRKILTVIAIALLTSGCWNPTPPAPTPSPSVTATPTPTASVLPNQPWPVAPTGLPTPMPNIGGQSEMQVK
jgi:hypothetical protein